MRDLNDLLADHQKEALSKLKDGNILWGSVGSGKSRVALAYYLLTEEHEDIYVITTAKKRDSLDWNSEAAKFGIAREPSDYEVEHEHYFKDASIAGKLVVDSWNNLDKYRDISGQFFVFDEQRLVGSGSWVKAFLKIAKKNRWIMLSATPGDTWLDYIPVFIANGFYRNRTEFKLEHVIYKAFTKYPKVERYTNVQRLVRCRNQILVHMPYPTEKIRHPVNVWCECDEIAMARVAHGRWNIFEDKPIRDLADLLHQMRRVANSDPSRIRAVSELLDRHDRLIVFYNFDYELELLRKLGSSLVVCPGIDVAEWNGHKHEEIPDSERWLYIVQYIAGSEGWNCKQTNAECFYSLTYSYKLWEQAHGRIDRLDTEYRDLYYYILRSKASIDWAIWRSLMSKQSFQTKHFEMSDEEFMDYSYQRGED
ncbi:MAG: hypothetical protein ACJ8BW_26730 [Ktedonobacteraceae bacterium]